MLLVALLTLAPLTLVPSAPPGLPSLQAGTRARTDAELRRAFGKLEEEEQHDIVEWWRLEISRLSTYQLRLIASVLDDMPEDPGFLPGKRDPAHFDARQHTPKQVIERTLLHEDESRAKKARKKYLPEPDPRRLRTRYVYDWAGRGIRRGDELGPEEIFENALHGYPPDLGLALAWVLKILDRGDQHPAFEAFAHLYSDRKGRVYAGVTLYDVWRSGERFETPDVDLLGVVRKALDDRSFSAPLRGQKSKQVLRLVEEEFVAAQRYRGLRETLASLFLIGQPVPQDGYGPSHARLHALWEQNEGDPLRLALGLPSSERWQSFLQEWNELTSENADLMGLGRNRQRLLSQNGITVRERLEWVMQEYGVF